MELNLNITPLNDWLPSQKPLLISGPCSAESPEQVMQTAKQLGDSGLVSVLRAGIWKPRTRPNSFEGVGKEALTWLVDAAKTNHLKSATEVANVQHVESCLKAGVDILWIGARTSGNPFSVQEIADSLKGVDIPVLIKNPINPDLQLWMGALERINSSGITKIGAIHRGFSNAGKSIYRNQPMWDIAIELKALCPFLPLFCDPSHIAGNRELIPNIAQRAMDLDMDGLMIETHPTPDEAWSDAKQQITPQQLIELISGLQIRQVSSESKEFISQLEKLRASIDKVDHNIFSWLSERMELVEQIGDYKKANDVTILQVDRWNEIKKTRKKLGNQLGLSEEFVMDLVRIIHKESIRKQTANMNKIV
jgi:chorismate mutase